MIVGGGMMAIHSSGQTIFGFTPIECTTLGAGEDVHEVAGGVRGMGVGWAGEIGDRGT